MNHRSLSLCCIVVIAAVSASCAEPPDRDMELAKSKSEAARAAGAAQYAPAAMEALAAAQSALDAEMTAQSSKWLKSFDKASSLAVAVQQAADKAAADAAAARERLLAAARSDIGVTLGPNVFQNGDFANGTTDWFANPASDATVNLVPVEGARAWHVTFRKGNWAVINQEQVLKPDTIYVYEGWVKTTAPVVSLYWQSDIGRFFETDKTYPTWTRVRSVFVTPHWNGQPFRVSFFPC